jgi:hypothetical protein
VPCWERGRCAKCYRFLGFTGDAWPTWNRRRRHVLLDPTLRRLRVIVASVPDHCCSAWQPARVACWLRLPSHTPTPACGEAPQGSERPEGAWMAFAERHNAARWTTPMHTESPMFGVGNFEKRARRTRRVRLQFYNAGEPWPPWWFAGRPTQGEIGGRLADDAGA